MSGYFSIEGLTQVLGDFNLGPVNLNLDKGSYLVLLGPSGCGKTSLIKNIAGISGAHSGSIKIYGIELSRKDPSKRSIGYVSQTGDLFPHLGLEQNILFGLQYSGLNNFEKNESILYKKKLNKNNNYKYI